MPWIHALFVSEIEAMRQGRNFFILMRQAVCDTLVLSLGTHPVNMMESAFSPILMCACAMLSAQEDVCVLNARPLDMHPLPVAECKSSSRTMSDAAETYNCGARLWQEEMPGLLRQVRESGRADLVSPSGFTALHYAAMAGDVVLAEELLDKGADVHACAARYGDSSYFANTPLGFALGCPHAEYPNHAEMVRLLLKHGAEADSRVAYIGGSPSAQYHFFGCAPAFHAALRLEDERQRGEILMMLLERGDVDWQKRCREGKVVWVPLFVPRMTTAVVERMLQKGMSPDVVGEKGMTALHFAVMQGNLEVASTLLEHGADANASSRYVGEPLFLMSRYLSEPGKALAMAALLIDHGANVNAMRNGESLRIFYGKKKTKEALELCAYLRSRGALLHPDAQK